ncbi:hypothetical protein PCANC_06941 [Puccinia coronata f. sp. avenae]|uniref:Uncharacterized protein n=1 Tax=Puccinia coronata f. sp. avenae TaxID=200324 RepID=A0A2N5VMS3_9BASI|nr:hypothetical protein PCASD_22829 [Puccinia coronata f. sp. avenae]PLW20424.1 hypothetical protein PCANC_08325 [Puccinia coronata f. sp. avenae]PLW50583.1 hypothetical protein PCANC_06941 [Puccinia coronata f. sp. avenae]PLW51305.1 hypothetical protein PCASD_00970 [Puccinia coronata f. sp. avenae]
MHLSEPRTSTYLFEATSQRSQVVPFSLSLDLTIAQPPHSIPYPFIGSESLRRAAFSLGLVDRSVGLDLSAFGKQGAAAVAGEKCPSHLKPLGKDPLGRGAPPQCKSSFFFERSV